MKIKLDLGEVTLDDVMTYGFYALFVVAFIQPLAASIYIAGLCMLPLLALWASWEAWSRWQAKRDRARERAWMNGGYDAATAMERRIAKSEVYYPEY